jgi:hypothetical protein
MATHPMVVYWEDNDAIYLRFEGVTYPHFNTVLYSFKNRIPHAVWLSDIKAWRISNQELQEVAIFAYEVFGRSSLRLRGYRPPQQLELPWNYTGEL